MGFIKEKDHLGLLGISDFRECLKELAHHPKKEGCIHLGAVYELLAIENLYGSLAGILKEPVGDGECRLSEEHVRTFCLESNDGSDYGIGALLGNIAVL